MAVELAADLIEPSSTRPRPRLAREDAGKRHGRVGWNRGDRNKRWQGTKWLRAQTRHAIYIRDGFRCVYCNKHETDDLILLTADHLVPVKAGGSNHFKNLATCCFECNMSKQNISMRAWFKRLRGWGVDTKEVARKVRRARRVRIDRVAGMAEWLRRREAAAKSASEVSVSTPRFDDDWF